MINYFNLTSIKCAVFKNYLEVTITKSVGAFAILFWALVQKVTLNNLKLLFSQSVQKPPNFYF